MKNISALITQKARIKTREDNKLRKILCEKMDTDLIKHVQFLQIEKRTLKLHVKNSTWASRLRFFANDILHVAQSANISVSNVKIKITFHSQQSATKNEREINQRNIPTNSLDLLDEVALSVGSGTLQLSLQKLVKNSREKQAALSQDKSSQ